MPSFRHNLNARLVNTNWHSYEFQKLDPSQFEPEVAYQTMEYCCRSSAQKTVNLQVWERYPYTPPSFKKYIAFATKLESGGWL